MIFASHPFRSTVSESVVTLTRRGISSLRVAEHYGHVERVRIGRRAEHGWINFSDES